MTDTTGQLLQHSHMQTRIATLRRVADCTALHSRSSVHGKFIHISGARVHAIDQGSRHTTLVLPVFSG